LAPGTRFEYQALSNLYSIQGETEKAIITAKKMVEVSPKKAIGYGVVGFMYMKNGQFQEAAKWIEKALAISPHLLNDYNNLFSCHNYMGDRSGMIRTLNRASTYYEQFLALHADEQNWRCTYMIMLESVDRRFDSKREAERLLSMPDIHGSTYSLIAAVFARQGDVDKAVELLRAAARKGFFDSNDIHTDIDFWRNVHALSNFEELLVELEATAKENNV
jgi:tetratricopeptide (TPR) repeat protein